MDRLHRRSVSRPSPARETHDSIKSQTEAFIRQGGRIKTFPVGHTGFIHMAGPKQRDKDSKR